MINEAIKSRDSLRFYKALNNELVVGENKCLIKSYGLINLKGMEMCETFEDKKVDDVVDSLDCILFVGDRLNDDKIERDKLRKMLKRWEKRLDFLDILNSDEDN